MKSTPAIDHSGSQCGYCTPGFVMSLFAGGYGGELNDHTTEGNLCRCTGYAPIRRATAELATLDFSADRSGFRAAGAGLPAIVTARMEAPARRCSGAAASGP